MGSWREYKWEVGESISWKLERVYVGSLGEYKWKVGEIISGKLERV